MLNLMISIVNNFFVQELMFQITKFYNFQNLFSQTKKENQLIKGMYSILNHDNNGSKPNIPLVNQKYNMKTQSQSPNTYSEYQPGQNSKFSMKQLYKNQLDTFMQEKQRQKQLEKQLLIRQKEEYRQRMRIGQQNEKMKDLAYKNYYKLLMESQDHNKEMYVSPYEMRDKLKESHIQNSIDQQMQKSQHFDYEQRMREVEKKNQYRQQLARQIEDRKKIEETKKTNLQQENIYYRQLAKDPNQIQSYQKERKKEEKELYRQDLDMFLQDKLSQSRKNIQNNYEPKHNIPEHQHNTLINPLPYNLQNPYILKEMQKLSSASIKNDPQINFQQKNYQFDDRTRNQSSYFAKRGNTLLN